MPNETEVERLVVRMVGDGKDLDAMYARAEQGTKKTTAEIIARLEAVKKVQQEHRAIEKEYHAKRGMGAALLEAKQGGATEEEIERIKDLTKETDAAGNAHYEGARKIRHMGHAMTSMTQVMTALTQSGSDMDKVMGGIGHLFTGGMMIGMGHWAMGASLAFTAVAHLSKMAMEALKSDAEKAREASVKLFGSILDGSKTAEQAISKIKLDVMTEDFKKLANTTSQYTGTLFLQIIDQIPGLMENSVNHIVEKAKNAQQKMKELLETPAWKRMQQTMAIERGQEGVEEKTRGAEKGLATIGMSKEAAEREGMIQDLMAKGKLSHAQATRELRRELAELERVQKNLATRTFVNTIHDATRAVQTDTAMVGMNHYELARHNLVIAEAKKQKKSYAEVANQAGVQAKLFILRVSQETDAEAKLADALDKKAKKMAFDTNNMGLGTDEIERRQMAQDAWLKGGISGVMALAMANKALREQQQDRANEKTRQSALEAVNAQEMEVEALGKTASQIERHNLAVSQAKTKNIDYGSALEIVNREFDRSGVQFDKATRSLVSNLKVQQELAELGGGPLAETLRNLKSMGATPEQLEGVRALDEQVKAAMELGQEQETVRNRFRELDKAIATVGKSGDDAMILWARKIGVPEEALAKLQGRVDELQAKTMMEEVRQPFDKFAEQLTKIDRLFAQGLFGKGEVGMKRYQEVVEHARKSMLGAVDVAQKLDSVLAGGAEAKGRVTAFREMLNDFERQMALARSKGEGDILLGPGRLLGAAGPGLGAGAAPLAPAQAGQDQAVVKLGAIQELFEDLIALTTKLVEEDPIEIVIGGGL